MTYRTYWMLALFPIQPRGSHPLLFRRCTSQFLDSVFESLGLSQNHTRLDSPSIALHRDRN